MSSGIISSTGFQTFAVAGDSFAGIIRSSSYINIYGMPAVVYARELGSPDIIVPRITEIKFDGYSIKNNDYVASDALITANITDETGISTTESYIEIDALKAKISELTAPSSFDAETGDLYIKHSFGEGTHTFAIHAADAVGNMSTSETYTFVVSGSDTKIDGRVLNYPNPFAPPSQKTVIAYMLNKDADVNIYIFNMIGQQIKKIEAQKGSQGGKAGYNEVEWDGFSNFGDVVPNDVYFCKILSSGKVLGKCKIAVLK